MSIVIDSMKISRNHLRKIMHKELITILNESIRVRNVKVDWSPDKPEIFLNGHKYKLSSSGIGVTVKSLKYNDSPEGLGITAIADMPWPMANKEITSVINTKGIDNIVDGLETGKNFMVYGKNNIKFKKA